MRKSTEENLPESFFLNKTLQIQPSEGSIATAPIDIIETNKIERSISVTPTKKDNKIFDILQFQRGNFEISAKTSNSTSKDELVHCVSYKKNLDQIDFDARKATGHLVFGVSIDEIEKDEKFINVPKFVVECINIIENEENIRTNGIYRASGKKESIDKIKKKMNETKPKKGSKYSILQNEDVHAITGALKQFFRELKPDLIPMYIFQNVPYNLETEDCFKTIAMEINSIDSNSKFTLKYLLRHLRKIHANSQHNLMNASNLSIVWGACLFTSSVTFDATFETGELIRKNNLIRILIERYDDIFPDEKETI